MTKREQILSLLPDNIEIVDIKPIPGVEISFVVSDKNAIWLMVGDGSWHKLEKRDKNYHLVADSILNKLKWK